MNQSKILVVEDDAGLREALMDTLKLSGYQCIEAQSGEDALLTLKEQSVDLVVSDVQMDGMSGLTLLNSIKRNWPNLPVLIMTAYGTIHDAVQAMRDGACNYMAKPFAPEVLLNMVNQYVPLNVTSRHEPVVADAQSIELLALAKKVATTDASVMVLGPSGSGKEVLAQYVHYHSNRSDKPFVAINCAAIPENMLEATLFGYEKGAFTGAIQACPGKFEQAQGGTILLDEITEMDLGLQAKILRVLQEREVERLGGRKTIKLDVRVIATSNRDLRVAVKDGIFREDLYYRLNVFPLTWLALNKRRDDIVPLAKHLITQASLANNMAIPELTASARNKLTSYDWPGNVRELDNVIQRAIILHSDQIINAGDLLIENFDSEIITDVALENNSEDMLGNELKIQEHQIILDTLTACQGSRKDVAERLGISPRTLRYKIARMRDSGIQIPA
ncbi:MULTISPECIES: sigma-54 dependent transcriptional regulator [unclassified Colwellia]|uniref:sigma-54-dependent transcriptional regulator n=1 Tax=unclassified Colwellia TaxID=196834 RepID=UPI0015F49195|nr:MULTISPECIES: sigma-54 dependent transcriptional regulator [unclassified Colwellia]MBA6362438.1 sigma-54-dependent Fis family transcriptional regulator [Colwellia sp. BRX8-8]MBA6335742.1 sigma-54-dependent Fis family transcriptional regulator [Colwellia sp. BRX8-7]MBA6370393.1 sigma-54-dependent Fis family transcriptional regulator [Colwellia sp. BRX8-4]MBA6379052.1 sigma-54-dependent Fis family transcriptional regulator [Colwellia sp. BRX10-7]MBA6382188.1 sigma-54-dependent Fis family tran